MLALCVWATLMLAEHPPAVRAAALCLPRPCSSSAFFVPTPLGQNALRPGLLLGPSLLVSIRAPRAPRGLLVAAIALLVYLQWLPAVRAVGEASGDRSTKAAFHQELLRPAGAVARPGERVEMPLTRNHWEAAYVAEDIPLGARLAPAARPRGERALLRRPAAERRDVSRMAQGRGGALGRAAEGPPGRVGRGRGEAAARGGVPGLRLAWRTPDWTVWEVFGLAGRSTGRGG